MPPQPARAPAVFLAPARPGVRGQVLDPDALVPLALEIAARERAPNTRRAYAAAYRALDRFLAQRQGRPARRQDLTAVAVRAWRDQLEDDEVAATTIAARLSAVRKLAAALDADPAIHQVHAARVAPGEPRALSIEEYGRLLAMPDRRTRAGRRDHAVLLLLGDAGLRRSEAAALRLDDVVQVRRHPDPRWRPAVARGRSAQETDWAVRVRRSKRGKPRTVPLSRRALDAVAGWAQARPACPSDRLLVSLPAGARAPAGLSADAVGELVAKHARHAGLPEELRTAHALRHTFCTHLAEAGVPLEVIAELAGHVDLRTTKLYVKVTDQRRHAAIHQAFDAPRHLLADGGAAATLP
jgi:site-specific recombinase XerD